LQIRHCIETVNYAGNVAPTRPVPTLPQGFLYLLAGEVREKLKE